MATLLAGSAHCNLLRYLAGGSPNGTPFELQAQVGRFPAVFASANSSHFPTPPDGKRSCDRRSSLAPAGATCAYLLRDLLRDETQAWLHIPSPKTRFRGATEQTAGCDECWVVELLDAVFGDAAAAERFWPASHAASTRRWDAINAALGVSTAAGRGMTPASPRGGGLTQFYALTEDLSTGRDGSGLARCRAMCRRSSRLSS